MEENREEIANVSFYTMLKSIDVIDPILEPFMQGKIIADIKTKKLSLHPYMALNRTWVFAKVCQERKCGKWLGIYYSFYKIFPPPCKACWKIVYVPSSLSELFAIQKFQEDQGLPAKCGTEARDYTSGLGGYRAFWYCPYGQGLEGGRKHYQLIKEALRESFGADYIEHKEAEGKLYLKRGCTELERDFGPSDQWDQIDFSGKFNLLETVWEDPQEMVEEWEPIKLTNLKRWIEYAVAHGDRDALGYVQGKKLGVASVTYHNSEHKDNDFSNSNRALNGRTKGGNDEREEKEGNLFRFES